MSQRVVSLIASATEIVAALGCLDRLVGRSHECDYPPDVAAIPVCSGAKFDVNGDSREIDERVKQVLREGTSVYWVDRDQLEQLAPTVIITQSHCEVCAVSLNDVRRVACDELPSRPRVVACAPNWLGDVAADIRQIAQALEVVDQGERLIESMQARWNALAARVPVDVPRPTIACIEWIEPLMVAGNWVPELVALAGGTNLLGTAGEHSPWTSFDAIAQSDPDVIAIMPCGFDLPRVQAELHWLTSRPDWPELRAVREGRVALVDGNQYFNRPGPRLVESAEILFELLHPAHATTDHRGTGWVPLEREAGCLVH